MIDDATLLRRYATDQAEDAFAELVRRHLPLVYSAALRRLGGDVHRAEDVAQVVFCALARKAPQLSSHAVLTGWLYIATRNAVLNVVRAENRRRVREQEAHIMHENSLETESPEDWSQLRPVLDTAMDQLNERDREAVLLRFFQGLPFAEIGRIVGVNEDAARKRVDRALDKLRDMLRPHGVASTSAALAALLAHQTVSAAPTSLEANVTGAAIAAGSATTSGIGALGTVFTLTKLQVAALAAVAVGAVTGLVTQHQTISELRDQTAALRQQVLATPTDQANETRSGAQTAAEITRLRAEVARLPLQPLASPAEGPVVAPIVTSSSRASAPATAGAVASTAVAAPSRRLPQKPELHRRYDPFLQKHGLTPAQAERFVELKIAIAEAQSDLQSAMRRAGAQGGTVGVEEMRSQLVKPMWDEIRQLLGDEGYAAYGSFERTSFYRLAFVEPMLPAFTRANAPLAPDQADQLVRIFEANGGSIRAKPTDLSNTTVMNWDRVAQEARTILSPAQFAVLERNLEHRRASSPTR